MRKYVLFFIILLSLSPGFTENFENTLSALTKELYSKSIDNENFSKNNFTHAMCISPILKKDSHILINFKYKNSKTLIFQDGRLFLSGIFVNPEERWPILSIRPIDDNQMVNFIFSAKFKIKDKTKKDERAIFIFNIPSIFSPSVDIDNIYIKNGTLKNFYIRKFEDLIPEIIVEFKRKKKAKEINVILLGEILLEKYEKCRRIILKKLKSIEKVKYKEYLTPIPGRDYKNEYEKKIFSKLAKKIKERQKSEFGIILKTLNVVCKNMTYMKNNDFFTPFEILLNRKGDCNDYSRITVTLLRFNGIPCQIAYGALFDFKTLKRHAWVEVGLPLKLNKLSWLIVDPTISDSQQNVLLPENLFCKDKIYVYPISFRVASSSTLSFENCYIFLNSKETQLPDCKEEINNFINKSKALLKDYKIKLSLLVKEIGLNIYKNFPARYSDPIYLLDEKIKGDVSIKIKLDFLNNLYITISKKKFFSSQDDELIKNFKKNYKEICKLFKGCKNFGECLNLKYNFDENEGKIKDLTIFIKRYPFEKRSDRILQIIHKNFISQENYLKLKKLFELTGGKNLYIILNHYLNQKLKEKNPIFK